MADTTTATEITAKDLKEKKEVVAEIVKEAEKENGSGDAPANGKETHTNGAADKPAENGAKAKEENHGLAEVENGKVTESTDVEKKEEKNEEKKEEEEEEKEEKTEEKEEKKEVEEEKKEVEEEEKEVEEEEKDAVSVKRSAEEEEEAVETKKQKKEIGNGDSKEAEVEA